MHIGLSVKRFTWPGGPGAIGPYFTRIVQDAERIGFDSFWVMDHFFQIPKYAITDQPELEPMLESGTALAFAAGRTERIRVGAMVAGVTYRHPAILVQTLTTLDVLSGGRAYFGLGAAWHDREHAGLGVPFPSLSERFERLEESLKIARHMWEGNAEPIAGAHYQLAEPINVPNSVRRPRPPILIGGGGERKTLRLVAQYGDACNLFDEPGLDVLAHKLDVLRAHCETVGRPYDEIEKTVFTFLTLGDDGSAGTETVDQALTRMQALADLGIDHVMVELPEPWHPAAFDRFETELLPAIKAMQPAGRTQPLYWW